MGSSDAASALPVIREIGRAPPIRGFRRALETRRISISAATGFEIEHKVQVVTMVSKTVLPNGICSAEPLTSDTGTRTSAILFLANRSSSAEGSIAQTWSTADL
jgi:hypothetical protein